VGYQLIKERVMKTTNIQLTAQQVDLLRGVLFEYFKSNEYFDKLEEQLHSEVEEILADAENDLYKSYIK
jgi:hypothetical protein